MELDYIVMYAVSAVMTRLKSMSGTEDSPDENNGNISVTKMGFQVGEHWLCFDMEGKGLHHVSLL